MGARRQLWLAPRYLLPSVFDEGSLEARALLGLVLFPKGQPFSRRRAAFRGRPSFLSESTRKTAIAALSFVFSMEGRRREAPQKQKENCAKTQFSIETIIPHSTGLSRATFLSFEHPRAFGLRAAHPALSQSRVNYLVPAAPGYVTSPSVSVMSRTPFFLTH